MIVMSDSESLSPDHPYHVPLIGVSVLLLLLDRSGVAFPPEGRLSLFLEFEDRDLPPDFFF